MPDRSRRLPTMVTSHPEVRLIISLSALEKERTLMNVKVLQDYMAAAGANSAITVTIHEQKTQFILLARTCWRDFTKLLFLRSRRWCSIFVWWGRSTILLIHCSPTLSSSDSRLPTAFSNPSIYWYSSFVAGFSWSSCSFNRDMIW